MTRSHIPEPLCTYLENTWFLIRFPKRQLQRERERVCESGDVTTLTRAARYASEHPFARYLRDFFALELFGNNVPLLI